MGAVNEALRERLERVRGGARQRSPNVRVLAAYAGLSNCGLASLGFAARVDFDLLLRGTPYEAQFGQSPFAFQRGNRFEGILRKDDYAAAREVLKGLEGFDGDPRKIVNLRRTTHTAAAMEERARDTRREVSAIVRGEASAASLIDGAVLETEIAGLPARFEADAVAARGRGVLHAGEVKSFPIVDGRGDPDKIGAALDQVAVYILLLRRLMAEVGGRPELVSDEALLITPTNVGLQPMLSRKLVGRQIGRIDRLLQHVPRPGDLLDNLPADIGFAAVADTKAETGRRVDALRVLAEKTGTTYGPACVASCGNARFCREQAFEAGKACLIGPSAERQLAGVPTLGRAADLSDGAAPRPEEQAAAAPLAEAGRLYDLATHVRRRSAA